ncbi:hypothetical protein BU16DRAFT_565819 [Lophium mytilinum]|uniref:Uncharacterized protein n=1 Tax=Lophium mytilinum TaxID=390894 RepID=A0A6A6QFS6_9PEZI|nr:hypothetical protein BU16DRAFT_565819 [Lophium mytilinum]
MASGNRSRLTSNRPRKPAERKERGKRRAGMGLLRDTRRKYQRQARSLGLRSAQRLWSILLRRRGAGGHCENGGAFASLRQFARSKAGQAGWGHGLLGCVCWAKRPGSRTQLEACMMAARVHDLFVGCVSWAEASAAFRPSESRLCPTACRRSSGESALLGSFLVAESWPLAKARASRVCNTWQAYPPLDRLRASVLAVRGIRLQALAFVVGDYSISTRGHDSDLLSAIPNTRTTSTTRQRLFTSDPSLRGTDLGALAPTLPPPSPGANIDFHIALVNARGCQMSV